MNAKSKILAAAVIAFVLIPSMRANAYPGSSYISPAGVWVSSPCVSLDKIPCEQPAPRGDFDLLGDLVKTAAGIPKAVGELIGYASTR